MAILFALRIFARNLDKQFKKHGFLLNTCIRNISIFFRSTGGTTSTVINIESFNQDYDPAFHSTYTVYDDFTFEWRDIQLKSIF